MRKNWKDYKKVLVERGYSKEELKSVKEIREKAEHCSFEQFQELWKQGIVKRTRKLIRPRNLYVTEDGKIWYLNHYNKRYEYVGYFKNNLDSN